MDEVHIVVIGSHNEIETLYVLTRAPSDNEKNEIDELSRAIGILRPGTEYCIYCESMIKPEDMIVQLKNDIKYERRRVERRIKKKSL
jgi:hypothetical protein